MKRPIYKRFWFYGVVFALALVLSARLILPWVVLNQVNAQLASFSPLYALHIRDANLNLWRMAYGGIDTRGVLKKDASEFLYVKSFDVSLAFRELLRGRMVVDVDIEEARVTLSTDILRAVVGYGAEKTTKDAKNVKDSTVPFDLERLRLKDSSIFFSDIPGLPQEQSFHLTELSAEGLNLTPQKKDGLSLYTAQGKIQKTADLTFLAQVRPNAEPVEWSLRTELRRLELRLINPIAGRMIPLTFSSGELSAYFAARSQKNDLQGYVKPFFKDTHLVGDARDFKGGRHFIFELLASAGNVLLKNSRSKAFATKIPFKSVKNGKVRVDIGKAISVSLDNAIGNPIAPGMDETLDLK